MVFFDGEEAMASKRFSLWLWLIALAAVVIRLVYLVWLQPAGIDPDGLAQATLFWRSLHWQGELPLWWQALMPLAARHWPPLTALLNAAGGYLVGDAFLAARLLNCFGAGLLAATAGYLARELTENDARAGLVAGLLTALAPLTAVYDLRVGGPTWFALALTLFALAAVRFWRTRARRDLFWLTFVSGLVALMRYEALILLPVLIWMWRLHIRAGRVRDLAVGYLLAQGWVLALVWAYHIFPAPGAGWAGISPGDMVLSFPGRLLLTVAACPVMLTWPVTVLAIWGAYRLASYRRDRPRLWILASLLGGLWIIAALVPSWTTLILAPTVPLTAALAGVGWWALPALRGLRPATLALAVLICLVSAHFWLTAEAEHGSELPRAGAAVARLVPAEAIVCSDDVLVAPYFAGRDMRPLDDPVRVDGCDFLLLTDAAGAVHRRQRVDESIAALRKTHDVRVVWQTTATYRPLAGKVRDPALLAVDPRRAYSPAAFWDRRLPILSRAVLLAVR